MLGGKASYGCNPEMSGVLKFCLRCNRKRVVEINRKTRHAQHINMGSWRANIPVFPGVGCFLF